MFVSNVGAINSAAFGTMQNTNAIRNMAGSADSMSDLGLMASKEKKLVAGSLNDQLTYDALILMEESQKKVNDENIERTFSTFA